MSEKLCVRFGDMAQQITTKVNPKDTSLSTYVGLEHLDTGSLWIKRRGTPKDVIGEKLRVCKGDIIFGKRRVYQRKLAISDFDGICSAHAMVLRPKEDIVNKDFFPFFMQSDQFMERALQISVGSLSPTINWKTLANQEFTIPLLPYQEHSATTLWAVEYCIEKGEQFLAVAERAKLVLVQELFSKGIGHKEYKIIKEIGSIPKGWQTKKLIETVGNINNLIVGGPFGSCLKVCDYQSQGVPIIRLQNVDYGRFIDKDIKYISEKKANELIYHSFLSGDLVLAKLGDPIGKTCKIPEYIKSGIVVADVVRIRLINPQINSDYLLYILNSSIIANQLNRGTIGTTRPRVNVGDVRKLIIPLPDLDEQRLIAAILTRCDETITAARANVTAAKALKMKMINEILGAGEG